LLIMQSIILYSCSELLFVFGLYRHGARSPMIIVNSKDYVGQYWPKAAELTKIGYNQLVEKGKRFRENYIEKEGFAPKEYNKDDIMIISANLNRSIVSSEGFIKGMYPKEQNLRKAWVAKGDTAFNEIVAKKDYITSIETRNNQFGSHQKDLNSFLQSFHKIYYDKLKSVSGVPQSVFSLWDSLEEFCDAFTCSDVDKRDLTYLNVDLVKMRKSVKYCNTLMWKDYDKHLEIADVIIKPVLREVANYINNAATGKKGPKVLIYFAQDLSIATLITYLKQKFNHSNFHHDDIPFASNILFEVRKENNGSFSVSIFYNDKLVISYESDVKVDFLQNVMNGDK